MAPLWFHQSLHSVRLSRPEGAPQAGLSRVAGLMFYYVRSPFSNPLNETSRPHFRSTSKRMKFSIGQASISALWILLHVPCLAGEINGKAVAYPVFDEVESLYQSAMASEDR